LPCDTTTSRDRSNAEIARICHASAVPQRAKIQRELGVKSIF
jgi:hypothetical protein